MENKNKGDRISPSTNNYHCIKFPYSPKLSLTIIVFKKKKEKNPKQFHQCKQDMIFSSILLL